MDAQADKAPLMIDREAVDAAVAAAHERIIEMGRHLQRVGLIARQRL